MGVWKGGGVGGGGGGGWKTEIEKKKLCEADRERGFAVDASSCNKPKKKRGKVTPSF